MRVKTLFAPLAALAVLATAAPAPAMSVYPAGTSYDTSKEASVTGVLTELQDIAPHPHWIVTSTGPGGATQQWDFVSSNLNVLRRQGVRVKEEIKAGRTFTFFYSPAWNGTNTGVLTSIVIDGKKLPYVIL